MEQQSRLELYEKLYFHALSTRDSVESRLKLPMTIFAIVFAPFGFLVTETLIGEQSVPRFYWILFIPACVCLFASICFFIRAWYGDTYKILPVPNTLEQHFETIKSNCEAAETEDEEGQALQWTSKQSNAYLLNAFKEIASHNIMNNQRKARNIHFSSTAIILSFVFISLAYIPYYYAVSATLVIEENIDANT